MGHWGARHAALQANLFPCEQHRYTRATTCASIYAPYQHSNGASTHQRLKRTRSYPESRPMGPSTLCDASREGGVTRREWANMAQHLLRGCEPGHGNQGADRQRQEAVNSSRATSQAGQANKQGHAPYLHPLSCDTICSQGAGVTWPRPPHTRGRRPMRTSPLGVRCPGRLTLRTRA